MGEPVRDEHHNCHQYRAGTSRNIQHLNCMFLDSYCIALSKNNSGVTKQNDVKQNCTYKRSTYNFMFMDYTMENNLPALQLHD
jgi:hypothetical protein